MINPYPALALLFMVPLKMLKNEARLSEMTRDGHFTEAQRTTAWMQEVEQRRSSCRGGAVPKGGTKQGVMKEVAQRPSDRERHTDVPISMLHRMCKH